MTEDNKPSMFQRFQNMLVRVEFYDGFSVRGRLLAVSGRLRSSEASGYHLPQVLVLENCLGFSIVRGNFVTVTLDG